METISGFEFHSGKEFAERVLAGLRQITPSKSARFTIMFSFCFDSEEFVRDYVDLLNAIGWDAKVNSDADNLKPWCIRTSRLLTADKKVLRKFGKYAAMALNEMEGVFEMWGAICLDTVEQQPKRRGWLSKFFHRN
jgi:hypothetical protein